MSRTGKHVIAATARFSRFGTAVAQPKPAGAARNIVIVHGGFVDGSAWRAVDERDAPSRASVPGI